MPRNANNTPVDKLSNYSIDFAANEYITCDVITQLGNKTQATWSGWFNRGGSGSYYIMGSWGTSGTERQFLVLQTPTALTVFMGLGTFGNQRTMFQNTSLTFTTGEWYHLMFVYDESEADNADKMKVYINNSEQTNESVGAAINFVNPVTSPFLIGTIGGYLTNKFVGQISQVSIFDYALSTQQRNYVYNLNNPMNITGGNPVAYWPLGDNSNIVNSTPTNTETFFPNISVGADSVFLFSGSQFINVPDSDSLSFGDSVNDSPFSMSAWIKTSSSASRGIISKWGTTGTSGYEWIFWTVGAPAKLRMNLNDGTNAVYRYRQGNTNINTGEWVHAVVTYDGRGGNDANDGIKIYVNGQEESSYTNGSAGAYQAMHSTDRQVQIGAYNSVGQFNGNISNAEIWDVVLQPSEILELYNNGQPLMTGTQPQEDNLQAWWKLNQSANWEADTAANWQIPDNRSAYPQSFNFDNTANSHIKLGSSLGNSLGDSYSGDLTLSLWFNADTSIINKGLFQIGTTTSQGVFSVRGVSGTAISFGLNQIGYTSKFNFSDLNNWHHLVCVYKGGAGGSTIMYLDGVPQTTTDSGVFPTSLDFDTEEAYIGLIYNLTGYDWDGKISNVQFWNTEIPAIGTDSVETLYNNGVPLTTAIASDNLKAWYKLDNT